MQYRPPTILTHARAYRHTPGQGHPACPFTLKMIGVIHIPERHDKGSLYHCPRCKALLALYCGKVVWTTPMPPAAVYREEEEPSHARAE